MKGRQRPGEASDAPSAYRDEREHHTTSQPKPTVETDPIGFFRSWEAPAMVDVRRRLLTIAERASFRAARTHCDLARQHWLNLADTAQRFMFAPADVEALQDLRAGLLRAAALGNLLDRLAELDGEAAR